MVDYIRRPGKRQQRSSIVALSAVADHADVSTATVSRVLNGTGRVSDELRRRVQLAIRVLGYIPNGAARALSSRRMRTIGAVVPSLENAGFASAVAALQRRLNQVSHALLLSASYYDLELELNEVRLLLAHGVDGMMLVGGEHHGDLVPLLEQQRVPFVETWTISPDRPSVGFDNVRAASMLTQYLIDIGHRRIGVIAGRTVGNDRAEGRVAGVRRCLAVHGLALSDECLIERPYRILDGRPAMRELLSRRPRPTAVICGNDQLAFGAMIEAASQGLSVPADISIAGFNDVEYAAFLSPPLTTVRVPSEDIGSAAADYLLARIEHRAAPQTTEVGVTLVVRGSTGPAPGGRRRRVRN